MINVELGIAFMVFVGMLVAVKEYLNQVDNQRAEERMVEEMEAVAARQADPNFRTRQSDLD